MPKRSRVRVVLLLIGVALAAGVAVELAWVSVTGMAVGSSREVTVSLAGAAALPAGTALILLALISIVGAWVLPWWLRLILAAAGLVLSTFLLVGLVQWLIEPDTSTLIGSVSGSDVMSEQLHPVGPGLFALAAIWGYVGMLRGARSWPGLADRYQRMSARPDREDAGEDMWRALDRGLDPTDERPKDR